MRITKDYLNLISDLEMIGR